MLQPTSTFVRRTILAAAAVASALVVGCSGSSPSHDAAVHPAGAADAVTVDFFGASGATSHCAGTVLSANVVLTAAHCADGSRSARVRAPDANGQTAEVSEVLRYDWGQAADHTQEHDLALLVLRAPLDTTAFATANAGSCAGCNVLAYGRTGATTTKSDPFTLDEIAPSGRPFALRMSGAPGGGVGGGGVKATNGTLVGVFMGKGAASTDGYVARIDQPEVQIWLSSVVDANGGVLRTTAPHAPVGSVKAASIHVQNTGGGGTGGSGDGTGSGPDSTSDGSNDTGNPDEDVNDDGAKDGNDGSGGAGDGSEPPAFDNKAQKPTKDPPKGQARTTGDNYWFSSTPNDPAFKNDIDYAKTHTDATLVGAHGAPGHMTDIPDSATMKQLTKGKTGPLIVDSCYAGAKGSDGGVSNAGALADSAGVSRTNAYGCSGEESTPSSSTLYCDGNWVDGNGKAVPAASLSKYGMHNCKVSKRNSSGAWTQYDCP